MVDPGPTIDGGVRIKLGPVLARAGEGTVYELVDRPEWVAKVFHSTLTDWPAKLDKVTEMVRSPPAGSVQSDGFVVLTWPLQVVRRGGRAVGYVMARIDTATSVEIHGVSNPSTRANPLLGGPQWPAHATWRHLVGVAANLCLAVAAVHRVDAVIGDFQERNILVNDTTRVTLVDCDSMQFIDASSRQFLCGVGRPEFTAPELADVDLRVTARGKPSDLFALAVHIHLLLMGGNHPFLRGEWTGPGQQPGALALARSADWAGGPSSRLRTHPLAPSMGFLPEEIRRLFGRAFTAGARDPTQRPTAAQWRAALLRIEVVDCGLGLHQVPACADRCPWCTIEAERTNRRVHRQDADAGATVASQDQVILPVTAPKTAPTRASVHGRGRRVTGRAVAEVLAGFAAVVCVAGVTYWAASGSHVSSHGGTAAEHPPAQSASWTMAPDWPDPERRYTYAVTGSKAPGDQITVTYTDPVGRSSTQQDVSLPWSVTVTGPAPSRWGSVEATSSLKTSRLNCSITFSDGTLVATDNAGSFDSHC